jgi:predicted RNA-binding Zn-ribbon protein involved in translation (DUF1610 family)
VAVSNKTLSIKAKEGRQFVLKAKQNTKYAKAKDLTIDEENHTVTYHCDECGETVVFEYTPPKED